MKNFIASISSLLFAVACRGEDSQEASFFGANSGALAQAQDQKTVICPVIAQDLYEGHIQYGPRTRFVLKNTASIPVYVTFAERNGTEYSAANAHFQPAHLDPDAVLATGTTKVFAVHEGHVFHVRDSVSGELLMQHRAGLIPIVNRYKHMISSCPPAASKFNVREKGSSQPMRKFSQWKPSQIERFREEVPIHMGFRNAIKSQSGDPCPVDFFFVRRLDSGRRRPPQFVESLSLQLGSNQLATAGDSAWDANTKYERTYLGHEFVARLSHDDSVVVDHVFISPIEARDCAPKKKNIKMVARATAITIPVGRHNKLADDANLTNSEWETLFHQLNATTGSQRGHYYFKRYTE